MESDQKQKKSHPICIFSNMYGPYLKSNNVLDKKNICMEKMILFSIENKGYTPKIAGQLEELWKKTIYPYSVYQEIYKKN